jgi:hypothetical protein
MPCRSNLLEDFRMPHGMFTDREKHGFRALLCQGLKHGWRIAGPRTVVEGEHNFSITQEIVSFEVLEPEARSSGAVNFNDPRNAKRIRIAWACSGVRLLCECS